MTRTTTVCPECDSADLNRRVPGKPGSESATDFRCNECGAAFDSPDERPVKSNTSGGGDHHNALLAADPDAYP